ncbi:MAG: dTDP-4-dehydrorhamnose reductase [Muribaculaceae bacterium]|nr:dTDP-4-dehydrorhamnose reductase [Muribaculaceae bacterium]
MMKILITGANGQLGREMRNVLESELPGQTLYTDIHELDLTDAKAVSDYVSDNDITHIVNCAAYTAVDRAEEDKALCAAVNVDAVKNIANAADKAGAKIIHISTDYVFDGMSYRPYKESDKVNPISQYGTTKRTGETALLALAPDSIIVRTGWLYSPYGKNFVKTMRRLGREQKTLKVVADQIGTPTYALDLAKAIYRILCSHQWVEGIFHYSNEGVCSWYDFAKAIHRLSGITGCDVRPIPTEEYPSQASRPFYSILDKSRIKATYDAEVPYWIDSLQECISRIDNGEE